MSFTAKNIFELLPSIYRIRDEELGNPLQAFIEIVAREAKVTEENIGGLYENWFIETCEEWVVPYIGDLLGVRGLHPINGSNLISQRAYVANTLSYRRRKGIAPVLEQLSLDIAGWRAHVVEFFELLSTTQYMNHIRLHRNVAPDLRKMNRLDLLGTPFDTIAHTTDVRHIAKGRGLYNIPNIGLFIWRLQNYPVSISDAHQVTIPPSAPTPAFHFFTFDPMGKNVQLFNRPQTETDITHISNEINLPGLLRRRALFDELEARRQAQVDEVSPEFNYFDDRLAIEGDETTRKHPVFEIYINDDVLPIPPEEILICNLQKYCVPPFSKKYKKLMGDGTYTEVNKPIKVVVDPRLGRFIFSDPGSVSKARVSYTYGFSGDTGSGTYNRQDAIPGSFQENLNWQAGVSKTKLAVGSEEIYSSVKAAIDVWNTKPPGTIGIITIMDSCSYVSDLQIEIPEKSQLLLIAADWPIRIEPDTFPAIEKRIAGDLSAGGLRPHILGNINIKGNVLNTSGVADFEEKTGGEFTINGILLEGKLSVMKGNLGRLNITQCTLVPQKGGFDIGSDTTDSVSNQWLSVGFIRSITGRINTNQTPLVSLYLEDCIVDDPGHQTVVTEKVPVVCKRTTFFGNIFVKTLEAENCIFTENMKVIRRQEGCLRYSFVPWTNTETPRKFRCQPELEISTQISEAEKGGQLLSAAAKEKIRNKVVASLVPIFNSSLFGHHAYAQLSNTCPVQISAGSDDGSEMGVFSFLMQPQRAANLRIALDEYLPLGLEAGIFYIT